MDKQQKQTEYSYLESLITKNDYLSPALFSNNHVKRGLRDENGTGVLVGLTHISEVNGFKTIEGIKQPINGELYYRNISINELIQNHDSTNLYGFEEALFLLLSGKLPNETQLKEFIELLDSSRYLNDELIKEIKSYRPQNNIMNYMARVTLSLYSYDDNADDNSIQNVLRQCFLLLSTLPALTIYGYLSSKDSTYFAKELRFPRSDYHTAENILYLLRKDGAFTPEEAALLDISMILHMEHGGGNNSTFTNRLISSSGSDTYSCISSALCSLKGIKHGGAAKKVSLMMDDIKSHVKNYNDDEELSAYLLKILRKETFDKEGLIYGMGHAVYSLSDPREILLKEVAKKVSQQKGDLTNFMFYEKVEQLAPALIAKERNLHKPISANIDFFSGYVYNLLEIPLELFTPLFALSRLGGWSAHRLEELCLGDRIMRPAYLHIGEHNEYVPMNQRS